MSLCNILTNFLSLISTAFHTVHFLQESQHTKYVFLIDFYITYLMKLNSRTWQLNSLTTFPASQLVSHQPRKV